MKCFRSMKHFFYNYTFFTRELFFGVKIRLLKTLNERYCTLNKQLISYNSDSNILILQSSNRHLGVQMDNNLNFYSYFKKKIRKLKQIAA